VLVVEDPGQGGLRVHLLDVILGERERRRLDDLRREERLERLGDGQRDEAGPGPARGLADEERGAGVVERPRHHQELPERPLVAADRSRGKQQAGAPVVEALDGLLGRGGTALLSRHRPTPRQPP
jgi:hypothetical protein